MKVHRLSPWVVFLQSAFLHGAFLRGVSLLSAVAFSVVLFFPAWAHGQSPAASPPATSPPAADQGESDDPQRRGSRGHSSLHETTLLPDKAPSFREIRYEERYDHLSDPAQRRSLWARLKHVPLWKTPADDAYLSLGGSAVPRFVGFLNAGWGLGPERDGFYVARFVMHADLWAGTYDIGRRSFDAVRGGSSAAGDDASSDDASSDDASSDDAARTGDAHRALSLEPRLFVQLVSAPEWGRAGGPTPPDEDRLDLLQGFAELTLQQGDGNSGRATRSGRAASTSRAGAVTLRAGRQELAYGAERLVSIREGLNVRRSFDALLLTGRRVARAPSAGQSRAEALSRRPSMRLDLFAARPVALRFGVFDDRMSDTETFWGAYYTASSPWSRGGLRPSALDVYYLGYRDEAAVFNQGQGTETRHTIGVRAGRSVQSAAPAPSDAPAEGGSAPAGRPTLYYDAEAMLQWGTLENSSLRSSSFSSSTPWGEHGSGTIRAWSVAGIVGLAWRELALQPTLELRANIASGDRDAEDADLETFNPLFPVGNYFGGFGLAPANHAVVNPGVSVRPLPDVSAAFDVVFFWRQRTSDGVYTFPHMLIREGEPGQPRYIGYQPTLNLGWAPSPFLSFGLTYSWFPAGPFLESTGSVDTLHYLEIASDLRF